MSQQQDLDRNEEATPHKLDESRKRGSVAKSPDLVSFVVLAMATVALFGLAVPALRGMASLLARGLSTRTMRLDDPRVVGQLVNDAMFMALQILSPLLFSLVIVVIAVHLLSSGAVFSATPLQPDFTRLNPVTGFKRLLSIKILYEAFKSILKLAALGAVSFLAIKTLLPEAAHLYAHSAKGLMMTLVNASAGLSAKFCAVLALFALIDVLFSRWDFMRNLRMSQREIEDETKHREGDPRIKSRLRELRMEFLQRSRAVAKVPQADVLITNPTHLAVALRYEHGKSAAPQVLAKGAASMARQMRELAYRSGVPVVQNPPLARALYKEVEQDAYVPERWYPQVAKILVWVRKPSAPSSAKGGPVSAMGSRMNALRRLFGPHVDLLLVALVVGVLMVLFAPVAPGLLDFLILANFSFALLILLLTFYMARPVEFSTFPSLLLIATLFRLSLNVAATRLILSDADAGKVIGAIGSYVVGGNYVIGLIVFLILVVVQYVVVTNGAQRVSEVAARFTLDSMPGQQMSIDADLNMGFIDQAEAQRRRKNLEKEAGFYGAMDGASKFVKGDAIAGIVIMLINIVGGLVIGVMQMGMPWGEALQTYTLLTIGDGIVTQVPALVIAVGTGIIVTRSASDGNLSAEVFGRSPSFPKTLLLVAAALRAAARCCRASRLAGSPCWWRRCWPSWRCSRVARQKAGAAREAGSGGRRARGRQSRTPGVDALEVEPSRYAWAPLVHWRSGRAARSDCSASPPSASSTRRSRLGAAEACASATSARLDARTPTRSASYGVPSAAASCCPTACWRSTPAASTKPLRASRRANRPTACRRSGSKRRERERRAPRATRWSIRRRCSSPT